MHLRNKIIFLSLFALFCISPKAIFAAGPYYGLDEAANQAGLDSTKEAPTVIGNVIASILALIGVIFFVLMVYGGFLWMTAHGDSGQVDKGRETIIAAVIGIIIVVASYALTAFIMTAPTGGVAAPPSAGGNGAGAPCQGDLAPGDVKVGDTGADLGTPSLGVAPCPPIPKP